MLIVPRAEKTFPAPAGRHVLFPQKIAKGTKDGQRLQPIRKDYCRHSWNG
jgi:hypothetical protein